MGPFPALGLVAHFLTTNCVAADCRVVVVVVVAAVFQQVPLGRIPHVAPSNGTSHDAVVIDTQPVFSASPRDFVCLHCHDVPSKALGVHLLLALVLVPLPLLRRSLFSNFVSALRPAPLLQSQLLGTLFAKVVLLEELAHGLQRPNGQQVNPGGFSSVLVHVQDRVEVTSFVRHSHVVIMLGFSRLQKLPQAYKASSSSGEGRSVKMRGQNIMA